MAHSIKYKDETYSVGDTIKVNYRIKEGEKERVQLFEGILIKINGNSESNRMVTIRKISKSGIGVERIIPLSSPFIESIKLGRKSRYNKAKLYFLQNLSDQQLRRKLYLQK